MTPGSICKEKSGKIKRRMYRNTNVREREKMRKVVFTAVDAVKSAEMLMVVPHRMVCEGMAIVYRYVENGRFTNVITDNVAMELGFTESQLYEMAKENLKHFLPVLKEEEEGVFTITSLNGDMIGSSLALMPGIMDRVLNKTGAEQLYVTVEPDKVTVATKISRIFKDMVRTWEDSSVSRVMRYTREGFATI